MNPTRPWKVQFHHDGTKVFDDNATVPGAYAIDTSRPIDGTSAHADEASAHAVARRVSRHGGTARITLRDPDNGIEQDIRTYAPYEVAMDDLTSGIDRHR